MTNSTTNDETSSATSSATNSTTNYARLTKRSTFTGKVRTMEFPQYSPEEFEQRMIAWKSGNLLIQEAFKELSDNAREFILTGVTADEWDRYLSKDDDRRSDTL